MMVFEEEVCHSEGFFLLIHVGGSKNDAGKIITKGKLVSMML